VEGEEDGGKENGACINVSSDSKNRIDNVLQINIHSMLALLFIT